MKAAEEIISICKIAWEQGLLAGWSGNASMRVADCSDLVVITAAGTPKGRLSPQDCIVVHMSGEVAEGTGKPSSESLVHLACYEAVPQCKAILHTHPVYLQALGLMLQKSISNPDKGFEDSFLELGLFEAKMWRKRLLFAPALPPGGKALADAAGAALRNAGAVKQPSALWLRNHGLVAMGHNLSDALCLTEELEHLAQVQTICLGANADRHPG